MTSLLCRNHDDINNFEKKDNDPKNSDIAFDFNIVHVYCAWFLIPILLVNCNLYYILITITFNIISAQQKPLVNVITANQIAALQLLKLTFYIILVIILRITVAPFRKLRD